MKTYEEINEKIVNGDVVVVTAEEMKEIVEEMGPKKAAEEVDVVTTGTFGARCSSGVFLNFGHADPPIKMMKAWLNGVPAYCGLAAVDVYLGATELREDLSLDYGGAHVIEDLLKGKEVHLKAIGYPTDCYPRREIDTYITLDSINQAIMVNPRNVYQNYGVATNSTERTIYTYMGKLLPKFGNANYTTSGELNPLINDPYYRTIGIGTRIFIGGAQGYIINEGTQFHPDVVRTHRGVPKEPAATLAVVGDLKKMSPEFIKAITVPKYGVSMMVGIGIPIPILDVEMAKFTAVRNEEIYTTVYDYGIPHRDRPAIREVSYAELKSGHIEIEGKEVPTYHIGSYPKARKIAEILKNWIKRGDFYLQKPVEPFPLKREFKPLKIRRKRNGGN